MSDAVPGRRPLLPRQPLSLGDVIEGAVALYRATAGTAVRVVAVVYAPLAVLNALAIATTGEIDPRDPFAGLTSGDIALLTLSSVVGFLVGPLVGAVLTWVALQRSRDHEPSWGDAYSASAGVFGRVVGATLLVFLLALVAVLGVAIPAGVGAMAGSAGVLLVLVGLGVPLALVLLTVSYLLVPAIVIDHARPAAAVRRAWALLRVRLWSTLATVVVVALLAGLVSAAIGLVAAGVSAVVGPASFLVDALGSTLAAMITVPFVTYAALLVYVDAAVRRGDELPLPHGDAAGG